MEKSKKIIFTVTNDLTYDQRMFKICKSLSESGYSVLIIGRKLKNSRPLIQNIFNQKRVKCLFNKKVFFYLEYNVRLFFILMFSKVDIISSVDLDTLSACALVSKIRNKKLAFDAHEYFTQVPEVLNRKKVQKVWAFIEETFVPQASLCYTVGDKLAEIFSERLKCKFYTIKNVPETNRLSLHENISVPEEKFILYQGALNKSRGIENMILAVKELNIEFHIVGEGDLSQSLRNLVKLNNLENKVKFLGFMEPSELREYSKKAYLGLNVSENVGLSYFYSLNNKFFDYVHASLPSLLNKFPEYEKLNREFKVGILADADPKDLSNKVKYILENKNTYLMLKTNCQKAAQVWNWENEKKQLVKLYDRL